jgi:cyclopropane fatty-acyl-phospholipid synthase-like methyltransferase
MDDPVRIVAAGYDAVADRYAELERAGEEWPRGRRVADLASRLPPNASVLDLGCGNGEPVARELAAAGFEVVGVDVSAEQVRRARLAVPDARFEIGDMLEVEFPAASFHAVVSLYAIDHVPGERHPDVFRRIREWLRPGGLALVAIEDADQPGVVGEWLGAPMFFSTREGPEVARLVEEAGLEVLEADVETQLEGTTPVPYTWLLVLRPLTEDDQRS